MNGTGKAFVYFLEAQALKNPDKWWSIRELSCEMELSYDRTRKILTGLVLGEVGVRTKIEGLCNVYKFK